MTFFYSGNGASYSKDKGCDPERVSSGLPFMLTFHSIGTGEAHQDVRFETHAEVVRDFLLLRERQRGQQE